MLQLLCLGTIIWYWRKDCDILHLGQ